MAARSENLQLIARLTPLADVLALIEAEVKPVAARSIDLAAAAGRTLAEDAAAPARPAAAIALADGWALAAGTTLGAGTNAPVMLARAPPRVEAGEPMPPDTDSVAPYDAVQTASGRAEALVTVSPGDGMLPAGGDCDPALPLRRAGERLRSTDLAAFAAAGLDRVAVRVPRLHVLPLRATTIVAAAAKLVTDDIERRGAAAQLDEIGLDRALADAKADAKTDAKTDAIVAIGGTGSGRNDNAVQLLAREARLAVHGIALTPGETAALGFAGTRPVLLLPGRLDAALAVWLTLGRPLLQRLAGGRHDAPADTLPLARKVASAVGFAELVPVRRDGDAVEPLAARYLPLSSLARADGWILVPAGSEGYAAGTRVSVWPWP
jgi:molybdopterin molybdotransferase